MTLGQSDLQLKDREGNIIRLPSSGREVDAERFHPLSVTCTWGCRILPGNIGKVFRKEVGACCIPPSNGTLSKATGRSRDCLKRW
ncbi:hypothetical protein E2C01_036499 [Portunus trituberculatus]|uniref:Uncharacterized protein n=1 Tax=Portunus trituberculatus TaxID=210409 RepID=A0A5B7FCM7_PORTR|nr:hypothetical protein [Portunus trituberculatus]